MTEAGFHFKTSNFKLLSRVAQTDACVSAVCLQRSSVVGWSVGGGCDLGVLS